MRKYFARIEAALEAQFDIDLQTIDPTLTSFERHLRAAAMVEDLSAEETAAMVLDLGLL